MENGFAEEPIKPQSLITEEHIKKALLADKGKDAQIISWKVVDFTKKGDNYACLVSSVEVDYSLKEQNLDVTYIVKLNPCRRFKDLESLTASIFWKETKFYLSLLPELNSVVEELSLELLHFPQCFHVSLESEKQQIYLGDLRPKGFKMVDKRKGMDEDHTRLVLKELGRLHATSLLLQEKTQEPIESKYGFLMKDALNLEESEAMLPFLENYLATAVQLLKKVSGYERAISWAESLKPQLTHLFTKGLKSEKFNVVNHGDCWNNNLLFRYNDEGNPEKVILLDLQVCRKASLAIDLNYFMYNSLNGDVRKKNLKSFLSTYYDSFKSVMDAGGLEMHFTEEELLMEFRAKNIIGGIFGMMVLPIVLMESDDVPGLTGSAGEDIQRIIGEMRAKAMEMLDRNTMMKPRFLSMFDEFMETGLIP